MDYLDVLPTTYRKVDGLEGIERKLSRQSMSDKDFMELAALDPSTLKPENKFLGEFILTDGCRRKMATEYFD